MAEKRKCKMCVCNRGCGVVGVAEERKCKMCVWVTGGTKGVLPTKLCYTHTITPCHFVDTLNPPKIIT